MTNKPRPSKPRPPAPATADALDAAVHRILQSLKQGKSVRLPGLGTLRPGPKRGVLFDVLQQLKPKEKP